MDFSKVKFRASSWGNLLSEPVSKADKESGKLSLTCQKELIKIYNREMYGRKKDITTACMEKGILCEDDSIKLFSAVEGVFYIKNQEQLENEWFTGKPDIYQGESIFNADEIHDIKSSFELDTFIPKLIEKPDSGYEAQLNVYFDLCNCSKGSIAYCLVDAPMKVLDGEKRKLLYNMDVISEESPEFKEAALELEKQLTFPDIDYRERVIKIPFYRNDELISKMKAKVPVLRTWLQEFHEKHMSLYPKQ